MERENHQQGNDDRDSEYPSSSDDLLPDGLDPSLYVHGQCNAFVADGRVRAPSY